MSGETKSVIPSPKSNSSVSRLQIELHPLQNSAILSRVFSFCSVTDLKNCRLVGSKLWLKASFSSWRKNALLRISSNGYRGLSFADFQKMFEDEEDEFKFRQKPFQSILLQSLDCDQMSWISEQYSEHLRHVTFADCGFPTLKNFMDLIFLRLSNLVELRLKDRINIKDHPKKDNIEVEGYPQHEKLKCIILQHTDSLYFADDFFPWDTFLNKVPNLENLQIQTRFEHHPGTEIRQIMRAISGIRGEDPSKLKIKNLEISSMEENFCLFRIPVPVDFANGASYLEDGDAEALLPLERFTGSMVDLIHLKPYTKTLEFLSVFFTKNLELVGYGDPEDLDSRHVTRDFPNEIREEKVNFPALKEFHARGSFPRVFRNLNKIEAPNLETLVVEDVPSEFFKMKWTDESPRVKVKLHNLSFGNVTKLECYVNPCDRSRGQTKYVFDVEEFTLLSSCMPNIQHVKIPLTGEAFTDLCRKWGKLRTLTVIRCDTEKKIGDQEITGVRKWKESEEDEGRLPNITDLKDLTDFECPYELSDVSVNDGFLQLPRLFYLNVKMEKISEEAKSALMKKVNILDLRGPVEPQVQFYRSPRYSPAFYYEDYDHYDYNSYESE